MTTTTSLMPPLQVCEINILHQVSKRSLFPHVDLNHTTTNNSEMEVVLNSFEGSLFAASIQLTGIFFAPFGGIISGWIGRRKTILLMSPFVSLGYLLIAVSQNKFMLLLGRFLSTTAMTLHVTSEGRNSTSTSIIVKKYRVIICFRFYL